MPETLGHLRRRGAGLTVVRLVLTNAAPVVAGTGLDFIITGPADFGLKEIVDLKSKIGVDPATIGTALISEQDGALPEDSGSLLTMDPASNNHIAGARQRAFNHAGVGNDAPPNSVFAVFEAIGK